MRLTALGALTVIAMFALMAIAFLIWQDAQRNDPINPNPQNRNG